VKRLVVTADDVGLDRGMTEGAIRAHREGIVTACSVVANGREFEDAAARLRDMPELEVGVHLTLVGERALTSGRAMPRSHMRFVLFGSRDVEAELRAQIERVLATGLRVTHLNGHQHLHQLPRVFKVVAKLAQEYGIAYIRRVNDRGGSAGLFRRAAIAFVNSIGQGTNDHTIGVMQAGHLTEIEPLLDHVEGTTELVAHPGIGVSGYSHWKYDWESETRALCSPALQHALARRAIQLVTPSAATRV
jgi:predicted glycoside hydrolase/deacetylase ChbG (UPF0249 family)